MPADHSVRQGLGGAGDPPDLRRASACPYGADVGAGALGSTASPITGHVDFVSRSRSIPLLTACGSSLGRSYATNAYSVATPRGRLDVAFRTRPTSSPFPIDAVPRFMPLSRKALEGRLGRGYASNAYYITTPRGRLDVAHVNEPTLEPFRVLSLFRFEAPLIGTWTTTRQDDAAKAYRLTTQCGRLDGAGEYGRRWAAPRRWRAGRAAAHSPHPSAASAHISVSVRRPTLASAGPARSAADSKGKTAPSTRAVPPTKRRGAE